MAFDLEIESEIEVERQRVEVFDRRVNSRVEIFGKNSALFAESKVDFAYFNTDINGRNLCVESDIVIVLPRQSKITSVRIEFDEFLGVDLLACKHLNERDD